MSFIELKNKKKKVDQENAKISKNGDRALSNQFWNRFGKKIVSKSLFAVYLLVLGLIGGKLFLGDVIADRLYLFNNFFAKPNDVISSQNLTIAYALPVSSLDPVNFDPVTRSRLLDVYEGLVKTNRNLKIQSSLAVSWGMLNQNTWEFRIRPGVRFHNGKLLTADDVVASLMRAKDFPQSQLKNFYGNVVDIKALDKEKIEIVTSKPDPLLLNKLAVTFIYPSGFADFDHPIGTGPYVFKNQVDGNIKLERFVDYWGQKPFYANVELRTILDKYERQSALENKQVQFLADVPPAIVSDLRNKDFIIHSIPSLEVNFIIFNLSDPVLRNLDMRKSLTKAFDRTVLTNMANGFARPVGQFVSSGIFGFNPDIKVPEYNLDKVEEELRAANIQANTNLTFDYPSALTSFGEYLQSQFTDLGLEIKLNPISDLELQKKILSKNSQIYFLGWRSELGDSDDFFSSIVHSPDEAGFYGQFNGSGYKSSETDALIEQSREELNDKKRLMILQQIMKKIVEEDVIGIPLFESEKIFAYSQNIHFEPRVDGYISAADIR